MTRTAPIVLLPPSEGKAAGGRRSMRAGRFDDALRAPRADVIAALGHAMTDPARARSVAAAQGEILDRARDATIALVTGGAPLLPTAERYTGVVWEHLGPLATGERARILVPSAVYGLTTGADPVADYRLKLSASLPGIGRLDRFWREPLTALLVRRYPKRVLVDLLPAEHTQAIDWERVERAADVVHVGFRRSDGRGAAGHAAKAAKGRFARCLLDRGLDGARTFVWDGWRAVPAGDGIDVLAPR